MKKLIIIAAMLLLPSFVMAGYNPGVKSPSEPQSYTATQTFTDDIEVKIIRLPDPGDFNFEFIANTSGGITISTTAGYDVATLTENAIEFLGPNTFQDGTMDFYNDVYFDSTVDFDNGIVTFNEAGVSVYFNTGTEFNDTARFLNGLETWGISPSGVNLDFDHVANAGEMSFRTTANADILQINNNNNSPQVLFKSIATVDFENGLTASGGAISLLRSSGSGVALNLNASGTYNARLLQISSTNASATEFPAFISGQGNNTSLYVINAGSGGSSKGIWARSTASAATPAIYVENTVADGLALHVADGDVDIDAGDLNMNGGDIVLANGYQLSATWTSGTGTPMIDLTGSSTFNERMIQAQTSNATATDALVYVAGNHQGHTLHVVTSGTNGLNSAAIRAASGSATVPALYLSNASGPEPIAIYVSIGDIKTDRFVTMLDWGDAGGDTPPSGYGRYLTNSDGVPEATVDPWYTDDAGNSYSLKPKLPTNYIHNFVLSMSVSDPTSQVVLGIGEARSSDDSTDITTSTTIPLDITTTGVNSLDAGTETTGWYYAWAIYNPTTSVTQGLISTSSTSPVMPSGYTKKVRVGTFYNDVDITPFKQGGTQHSRTYIYLDAFANRNVLTAGGATSSTQIDVSDFVPPVSFTADLTLLQGAARTIYYQLESGGDIIMEVGEGTTSYSNAPLDNAQTFWYYNSGASGDANIWVRGWRENL
jgi:hypothetical protein